jgi:hypothetical protein
VGVAIVTFIAMLWISSIRYIPRPNVRPLGTATAPVISPVDTTPPAAAPKIEIRNSPAVAKSLPADSALAGFRPVSQLEPRRIEAQR